MKILPDVTQYVFESLRPFDDFFHTDHRGWVVPNHERVADLRKYKAVLANCATEHWGDTKFLVNRLQDLFRQHGLQHFLILSHDPECDVADGHSMYFPFWLWQARQKKMIPPGVDHDKKFWLSSLAGKARWFRIANYLALQHKPYRSKSITSIHGKAELSDGYQDGFVLSADEAQQWSMIQKDVPWGKTDAFGIEMCIDHPAWSDTYLNLVNESTVKATVFITDKTWKPIMAGQLFLSLGNQGILKELRRLGFDTYDDCIDHGYDHEPDARNRLNMIHDELDRIMPNVVDIYKQTRDRRMQNQARFSEPNLLDPYLESINDRLAL